MPKTKLLKAWDSWRTIPAEDPKRLALLTQEAFRLDTQRKGLEKEAEAISKEVRQIKDALIADFDKGALKEIHTSLGVARLVRKDVPTVDTETGGWDAVWKYITKYKAYELVQKRFGEKAVQERWDAGESIPGVKRFTKIDIKLGDAE